MKQVATILLVAGCTFSAFADRTPAELKNLQAIRAKKIKEIDDAYVKALEKQKVKYTKLGDLESAIVINKELKLFSKPQEPKTDSQEQTVGNSQNDSIKKISDEWETCKVREGALVAIPLKTDLTYEQAEQEAERYGATLYCPKKRSDAKRMMDLLPDASESTSGNACWLGDVKYRLRKSAETEVYSSDGEEFDCERILGDRVEVRSPLNKRPDGTEGHVKIMARPTGIKCFEARKPGEHVNYLIILISDDS